MKGKILKGVFAVLSCVCLGFGLLACDDGEGEQTEMEKAYAQYVLYTEGEGREPLTYDEWLAAIIKGEKGDKGEAGEKGEDGKDGVNGSDGKDGVNGSDGKDGQDGVDGKSAYEIWLEAGHEGTEEDFLNWLKGEKGDKGDKGDKGEPGESGSTEVAYSQDLSYVISEDKTYYSVRGIGLCSDRDVIIPEEYRGLPVKEISEGAFRDCVDLTSIIIPDSVTTVGRYAFRGCTSLRSAKIGAGVKLLEYGTAMDCDNLAEIIVAENNTEYKSIDGNLYTKDGKTLLQYAVGKTETEFVIPDGVTTLIYGSFHYADNLNTVVIPDSVTTIDAYAFYHCENLTSVVVPASITSMGSSAFYYCNSLTAYCEAESLPSGWSSNWKSSNYGTPVVWNCKNNDVADDGYIYTVLDGVRYALKDGAAMVTIQPINLTDVKLQETIDYKDTEYSVTSIREYAFNHCENLAFNEYGNCRYLGTDGNPYFALMQTTNTTLSSYTIHEQTKIISCSAFSSCSNMTSIAIPASVITIGKYAFSSAYNLNDVYITDIEAWCNISFENADANPFCHASNLYLNQELVTELVIPGTVKEVKRDAFYSCDSLRSVIFLDGVTTVEESAFGSCDNLTNVTLCESITSIHAYSFGEYNNIFNWDEGASYLGTEDNPYFALIKTRQFSGDIHEDTKIIACEAVYGAREVFIPAGITHIGEDAFANANNLHLVAIDDLAAWCNISFANYNANPLCWGADLWLLDGEMVTDLVIPETVTELKAFAFDNCASLTSVVIHDNVTAIGFSAFWSCENIASVVIGSGVTTIEAMAFEYCENLTSVYYKGTASEWENIEITALENDYLLKATRYYYVENEADVPTDGGNYWHYDENGNVAVW